MRRILQGRRYDTQECVELICEGRTLSALRPLPDDASLPLLAPGFIDLQVNGYGGRAFNSGELSTESIRHITHALEQQGIARYLPTLTTDHGKRIENACRAIATACGNDISLAHCIGGIHLEGPYISPHDGPRGAHPREHVRPPSLAEFFRWQEAAQGLIRLITLSPEYENAPEFIRRVVRSGVVAAIGHTAASSEQIAAAAYAGATLSTHLGNGCHLQLPRHPNYLWEQLADDRLSASLIADGYHLPPATLKSFLRAKTLSRCILVSDYSELAGCPPGEYSTSLGEVELLPQGRLVVAGQRELLAGASAPLLDGIAHVMKVAGLSLAEAIALVTTHPAQLMNWIEPGFQVGDEGSYVLLKWADDRLIMLDQPAAASGRPD